MRLLFDENLSPRLVTLLAEVYPESRHVTDTGLASALDTVVWQFARDNSYVIVSKDSDFHQRSFLFGAPPKVVWIRLGNCSTRRIAELLRQSLATLVEFEADPDASFLALS